MLTQISACGDLFHTATGTAFADLMVDGHRETWPIRSKRFRGWLRRQYYEATGSALRAQAISSELDLLEAKAQFDAHQRSVHIRVAEHAGRIYLDLADDRWRAIEIGPDGWRVDGCPPVRFRRPAGMLPLPVPVHGGSIEALKPFLNLSTRDDFVLVVAWLLAALRSCGPYPLLAISGEQGSAKTVLAKMLKALVDPNAAPVRALPREERELMIAANNGHLLAFDNLSGLPAWLSDALCRFATGGSFAVRQLYTNDDEVLFQAARPLLVNGIEDVISRADLADRGIFLTLAPIREQQRRSETELWREFEIARPASWAPCLMQPCLACRDCLVFVSRACRGWPTSPSGLRLAEQRCGPRAPLPALMMQTVKPQSRGLSRPTRWQFASANSSRNAAVGREPPRTFCVPPRSLPMTMSRKQARAGQKIPARSPAGYGVRRRSFACWALKYISTERDEQERARSR